MKAPPGSDLSLRDSLADASDELLISRKELAVFLQITPIGVSNAVYHKRLPPPVKVGSSKGMPRWRLGDIRAAISTKESADGKYKPKARQPGAAKVPARPGGAGSTKRRARSAG